MSNTVDQRVVQMKFDNSNFEKNTKQSMETLDKLNNSLKLEKSAEGMKNIDKAAVANVASLSSIQAGVQALQNRFSTMGIFSMRMIENITDSVYKLFGRIDTFVKSGIVTGGISRAMNLENAHFQLQGLLKDEEKVQAVMANVGDAVDGTAYSLDAAANVASQFAASGIQAGDDMFRSLRAVAGVAATTNSSYQDIGQIFTTVAGNGRLMGEQLLQLSSRGFNAAATLGEALGKSESEIRDMVSKGQIDFKTFADAMDDAFGQHAKDANQTFTGSMANIKSALARIGALFVAPMITQNGPLVQFLNAIRERVNEIKGYVVPFADVTTKFLNDVLSKGTEILKKLDFTPMKKVLDGMTESFGKFSKGFKMDNFFNGLLNIGSSLLNIFKALGSVLDPIRDAFSDIFSSTISSDVLAFTKSLKELTSKLILTDEMSTNLRNTFKGLFKIISLFKNVLVLLYEPFTKVLAIGGKLINFVLSITGRFGAYISATGEATEKTSKLGEVLYVLSDIIHGVKNALSDGLTGILNAASKAIDTVSNGIKNFTGSFKNLDSVDLGKIFDVSAVIGTLLVLRDTYKAVLGPMVKNITSIFSGFGEMKNSISTILGSVKTQLFDYQRTLKANLIKNIAYAVGILAAALLVLSTIDSDALARAVSAMAMVCFELKNVYGSFAKVQLGMFSVGKSVAMLVSMSIAILILSSAMKKLAGLSWGDIARGVTAVTSLTFILYEFIKQTSKLKGQMLKGAVNLIILAEAIKILASVCKTLAGLSWEELTKGLGGVGILLGELSIFIKKFNKTKFKGKDFLKTAVGVLIIAEAIKVMSGSVKALGAMDVASLAKGLVSIGILLSEITLFTNKLNANKGILKTSVSLAIMAGALKTLSSVVKNLGDMSWEEIARGLTALGGALLELFIFMKVMPSEGIFKISAGLVIMGAALNLIVSAMQKAGAMSWESIAKSLISLGGALTILAIALHAMNGAGKGAASLLVASVAIKLLATQLMLLGNMKPEAIAASLITLAGGLGIVAGACYLLGGSVGVLLALSATLIAFGAACVLVGAGVALFGIGLLAVAESIKVLVDVILDAATHIDAIFNGLGKMIESFCDLIIEKAPKMAQAWIVLVSSFLDGMTVIYPKIADSLLSMFLNILSSLRDYIPQMATTICDIFIQAIEALITKVPEMVKSTVKLIQVFFDSLFDALTSLNSDSLSNMITCMDMFSDIIVKLAAATFLFGTIGIAGAISALAGMAIVINGITAIIMEIGAINQIPGVKDLVESGGSLLEAIGNAIGSFIGGIANGVATAATKNLPSIGQSLGEFSNNIKPFIENVSSINPSIVDGAISLAEAIAVMAIGDVIQSVVSSFTGGTNYEAFGEQLTDLGKGVASFGEEVKDIDPDKIDTGVQAVKELSNIDIPKTGGIVQWFTGQKDLKKFGENLKPFGKGIADFGEAIKDVDPEVVNSGVNAAKELSNLDIPKTGGIVQYFTGKKDYKKFGENLKPFGEGIANFGEAVKDISPEKIEAGVNAATILTEIDIPKTGGLVQCFTGEKNYKKFGENLKPFGEGVADFGEAVKDINPETITAGVNAANQLAGIDIQKTGGVVQWFEGQQDLAGFASGLGDLGTGIGDFGENVTGINPETILAGVEAAKALSGIDIEKTGGVVQWFTGQSDMAGFAANLGPFGEAIADFGEKVTGIDPETITPAANAAKALGDMAAGIPNSNTLFSFFTGAKNMGKFGEDLVTFAGSLANFSDAIAERPLDVEGINTAAAAGKALADMAQAVPDTASLWGFFGGGNKESIDTFGTDLESFGDSLANFSESVTGSIDKDGINLAADSGKILATMAKEFPQGSGLFSFFTGGTSTNIPEFGEDLVAFGGSLAEFSKKVKSKINKDAVNKAADAGIALAGMAKEMPDDGSFWDIFSGGQTTISAFGEQLVSFGESIASFSEKVTDIDSDSIDYAVNSSTKLNDLAKDISNNSYDVSGFKIACDDIASAVTSYTLGTFLFKSETIDKSVQSIDKVKSIIADLVNLDTSGVDKYKAAIDILGKTSLTGLITDINNSSVSVAAAVKGIFDTMATTATISGTAVLAVFDGILGSIFTNISSRFPDFTLSGYGMMLGLITGISSQASQVTGIFTQVITQALASIITKIPAFNSAGSQVVNNFTQGISNKIGKVKTSFTNALSKTMESVNGYEDDFYTCGENMAKGFAKGIEDNEYRATSAGKAIAKAAYEAAKKELDEHSPSKKMKKIGDYAGKGFINGLSVYVDKAKNVGTKVASATTNSIQGAISKISELVNTDIDTEPTIRPILDMSSLEEDANSINGLFNNRSIALASNSLGRSIDSAISIANGQNGSSSNTDVVNAITELRDDVSILSDEMSRLQVVMDNGALVGQIAPGVDKALGNIISKKGRGN